MNVAGGAREDGVVVGNVFNKYGSRNPIVRRMMRGFDAALTEFIVAAAPRTIHEVGCGEGYWVLRWIEQGFRARGSDFSHRVIAMARSHGTSRNVPPELFETRSIYDLQPERDSADLIVCCEVLEHLERPGAALQALRRVATGHLIVSVPREPLWRMLNMARGRYTRHLGNTPGHVQHWSRADFVYLVSQHFEVVEVRSPVPWTMLLCRASGGRPRPLLAGR